jgi:hypothetical protein
MDTSVSIEVRFSKHDLQEIEKKKALRNY